MQLLEVFLFLLAGIWQGVRQDFNLLEIAVVAALIAWGAPALPFMARIERAVAAAARSPLRACLAAGGLAIAIRLALLPVLPIPLPAIADEFSHLLLADTLLQGRLANPAHPFWLHFESLNIIQQPTYASNYFPGNALVLAGAIWLTGRAWFGVLLLSGVFCGVLCWALRAWLPPRWALAGSLLALLRFSIGSYWINAYHGGFLAAIGGALALGGLGRLRRRLSWPAAAAFAGGLATLAMTRPMEGALFSIPLIAALPFWRFKILVPLAAILGITAVALAIYQKQVTGSFFESAYAISQKTYGWPMSFVWAHPRPIVERNIELTRYYEYELSEHRKVDSPLHFIQYFPFRAQEYWRFFLGPAMSVPLLAAPLIWGKRRLRPVVLAVAMGFGAVMMEGVSSPHYLAAATAAIILLLAECFRHMYASERGRALARTLPVTMMAVLVLRIGAGVVRLPYTQELNFQSWCCKVEGSHEKARLSAWLEAQPGEHLVFVRSKLDEHNLFQWIYNAADIDRARIVWARDLGSEADRKLIDYYRSRRVWIVDPNIQPASIVSFLRCPPS